MHVQWILKAGISLLAHSSTWSNKGFTLVLLLLRVSVLLSDQVRCSFSTSFPGQRVKTVSKCPENKNWVMQLLAWPPQWEKYSDVCSPASNHLAINTGKWDNRSTVCLINHTDEKSNDNVVWFKKKKKKKKETLSGPFRITPVGDVTE